MLSFLLRVLFFISVSYLFVIACFGFVVVPGVSLHVFLAGPLFVLDSMHFIPLLTPFHTFGRLIDLNQGCGRQEKNLLKCILRIPPSPSLCQEFTTFGTTDINTIVFVGCS